MFQGLRTVIYRAAELEQAKEWYSRALGIKPYFAQPYYVGFNVGGYELGLDPNARAGDGSGAIAYWGVENAETELSRLLELGATPHLPLQDVGEGIRVASVLDPFGNTLGIIENPHFSLPQS